MTDLRQSLLDADLSHLRAIAETWQLQLSAPDDRQALDQLVEALLASDLLQNLKDLLASEEIEALIWLDNQGGQEAWGHFTRKFGEVRDVGAGMLEREAPHRSPVSTAERLWYKGLIGRGFFESDQGPREYAYLPQEVEELSLPALNPDRIGPSSEPVQFRIAAPREIEEKIPSNLDILNHITTMLAAARIGIDPQKHLPEVQEQEYDFYARLLTNSRLLAGSQKAQPEAIQKFFELSKGEKLAACWRAWKTDSSRLELSLGGGFEIEGEIEVDLPAIRAMILTYLDQIETASWVSLESFISRIKDLDPDFLRLGGDYEAWFIRDIESGEQLRGFASWDNVEGELIRFVVTGPLHWLGIVDLGAPDEDSLPLGFSLTELFPAFIEGEAADLTESEDELVQIRSKGEIRIPESVPYAVRYQVARFCDWGEYKADAYLYSISPVSLGRAEKQGLKVAHLMTILKNHTENIPPNITSALQRWKKGGLEVHISPKTIMRLGSPEVLKALQRSPAERFIEEQLGPTVVVIRPGSAEKIAQALMELGFLVDWDDQAGSQT